MKSPTPASFLVELFKKLLMNMVKWIFFSVEKHLFFQDSLMFHQEKLSYNLPAVKEGTSNLSWTFQLREVQTD